LAVSRDALRKELARAATLVTTSLEARRESGEKKAPGAEGQVERRAPTPGGQANPEMRVTVRAGKRRAARVAAFPAPEVRTAGRPVAARAPKVDGRDQGARVKKRGVAPANRAVERDRSVERARLPELAG